MSTRGTPRKAKSTAGVASPAAVSTPPPEKPSTPRTRSHSPLSVSRMEEKEELAHLNDRFAGYIDYVRSLEQDKTTLQRRIDSVTETQVSEMNSIRSLFEDEMATLRKALDDMAREKAGLEVDQKKLKSEWEDMKNKLNRRENDVRNLEKKLDQRERECAELRMDHTRYSALLGDHDQLKKQFETAKKQLEQETLLRTDLENKIQTLKEELNFMESIHREESQKIMERSVIMEEKVQTKAKASYDSKLREELQAMREQSQEELQDYKDMMEDAFSKKLEEVRIASDRSSVESQRWREDVINLRQQLDSVKSSLSNKTAEVDALNTRVRDLTLLLEQERETNEILVRQLKEENSKLRKEIQEKFNEFNDLMAVKIGLDQELLTYRKMLEGEEERCCLSPGAKQESPFYGSGRKRRRVDDSEDLSFMGSSEKSEYSYRVSTSAKGPIRIDEVDAVGGAFIRLLNESEKDVVIGNWTIKYTADSNDPVNYKFHRGLTIKPGAKCTVWSSNAGVTHNSPTDLVLKAQRFFGSTNHVSVAINDADGKEQASSICDKEMVVTRARQTVRRPATSRSEEKCSVM